MSGSGFPLSLRRGGAEWRWVDFEVGLGRRWEFEMACYKGSLPIAVLGAVSYYE